MSKMLSSRFFFMKPDTVPLIMLNKNLYTRNQISNSLSLAHNHYIYSFKFNIKRRYAAARSLSLLDNNHNRQKREQLILPTLISIGIVKEQHTHTRTQALLNILRERATIKHYNASPDTHNLVVHFILCR